MLLGQKGVKYGLQVRGAAKPAAAPAKKRSVFVEDESDEDVELNVEQQIARQAARKQTDKKVADLHAAALAEDASIFDYDGHYDTIQESRAEPKKQEKLQRQSRYIAGLLEKAEERKQESDILYERQLAKERAAEDHLFGDKEKFVTGAYRAKLAERQQWQEEQKRKKELEEANAVEKRGHMGDFYRNLLRSNVAFGGKPAAAEKPKEQPSGGEGAGAGPAAAAAAAEEQEPEWEPRAAAAADQQRQQEQQQEQQQALLERQTEAGPAAPGASGGSEAVPRQPAAAPAAAAAGSAAGAAATAAAAQGGPPVAAAAAAAPLDAGVRRNKEDTVAAARERYLARKRQKTG